MRRVLILLAAGALSGFASPAMFYLTDGDGTWQVGLLLVGAVCGPVIAVPFYFMTARCAVSSSAG
jgi:hypothetical protein